MFFSKKPELEVSEVLRILEIKNSSYKMIFFFL